MGEDANKSKKSVAQPQQQKANQSLPNNGLASGVGVKKPTPPDSRYIRLELPTETRSDDDQ